MTRLYDSARRSNQRLKRASIREIHGRRSIGACGSGQNAESIGSSENDTKRDTSTEQTIVRPKGLNHWPAMPPRNAIGMKTTTIDRVVAVTAMPISFVPSNAAR